MRPKPAESRSARANRNATTKEFDKKGGETDNCQPKKQDLSVLRRPVDTSICGLKDAVKVFETGTPELKEFLEGRHFQDDDKLKEVIAEWFKILAAEVYSEGLEKNVSQYDKCLNLYGDYVEK